VYFNLQVRHRVLL